MSKLLWTCEGGTTFRSELNGLKLTVVRAPGGAGYRYQLFRPETDNHEVAIASGHRDELREAISAAERTLHAYGVVPARPEIARSSPAMTSGGA